MNFRWELGVLGLILGESRCSGVDFRCKVGDLKLISGES